MSDYGKRRFDQKKHPCPQAISWLFPGTYGKRTRSVQNLVINPAVYKLSEIASTAVEESLGGNLQSGSTDGCSTLAEERNRELELAELRRYYEDLLKSRDERIAELRASVQEKMDVINSQKGIIAFLERHTDF